MDNSDHVRVVRALYRAFMRRDVPGVLRCLSNKVVFTMPRMPRVPLKTKYSGKKGVRQFLKDREPLLEYTAFQPHHFFSDRNNVLVRGETAGKVIKTGRRFRYKWIQVFEFSRSNLIRGFHESLDTHALVRAFARRR